jgi:predicted nucleic acid-binding protein
MPAEAAVVDASALAALLFGEPRGPDVAEQLDGRVLFAPTLLRYEVSSVCRKKTINNPGKVSQLRSALELFSRLGIREVPVPPSALVEAAAKSGLTTYDAAYLWLAKELGAELVTLDETLRQAASGSP